MEAPTAAARVLRFGIFELDAHSGELRRHGLKVRLPDQAFQTLRLLLASPGEVVTREALRQQLWTSDTFVDFDVGLNCAIRKLREALDDSAENPRFVETLPRRGYRFIAPVQPATTDRIPEPEALEAARAGSRVRPAWIAGGLVLAAAIATLALALERGSWERLRAGPAAEAAIDGRIAAAPAARGGGPRAVNPEAYDAYLKGVATAGRNNYDGFRSAVAYFEDAVARQPDYADAYAALGQSQLQFLFMGPLSPRETIPKAEAAARKAVQLDETLAQPHRTLGIILTHFYWQWEEGDKEFRRARELGASLADTPGTVGTIPIPNGQLDEVIASAERVRQRDPISFNAQMNVAGAYRAAARYDRAVAEFRRALKMAPGHPRGHFQLGVTFMFMGHLNDAIAELETAVVRSAPGGNPRFQAYLGYVYAAAGRPRDARRILKELEARARQQYVSSFGIALVHDALGEKEPALAAFERAIQDRAVEFAQMSQYPPFKRIAFDPRFQARMREIGLPR